MLAPHTLFPELVFKRIKHVFTLRQAVIHPAVENLPHLLRACDFPGDSIVQAEQTHGNHVAVIDANNRDSTIPQVDALITNTSKLTLVIRTADCGPLYFYDPHKNVIAVAHSGRKGTEQNILAATIQNMQQHFACEPQDIICMLGPCIRPPHYEVDIAAAMAEQAKSSNIQFHDCGENTGSDLSRYYSYRIEKGQTQRHFAAIRLL
ncbi:MAG: polyphenol oxidase family protein [Verrucomicrobiota bacterium]